jgi:hypothetical protein
MPSELAIELLDSRRRAAEGRAPPVGTELERYRDKAKAREAAELMRARDTGLRYVDIIAIETLNGEHLTPRPVDSM